MHDKTSSYHFHKKMPRQKKGRVATRSSNPYNRNYYLSDCDGHVQYKNSRGKVLGKRLKKIFLLAGVEPGMSILDIGCGRGELVLNCALLKASVWGIDTSPDAINISNTTLDFWEKDFPHIKKYACFIKMNARKLYFKNNFFDVVILSDIVEHLYQSELKKVLQQIYRVLKSSGKVIIHTSPNKYYLPASGILFQMVSLILCGFSHYSKDHCKKIPLNLRKKLPVGLSKQMHVNEQSSFGLKRILHKTGFDIEWFWFELNPHYINRFFPVSPGFKIINFFRNIIPIKHIFYADLYCIARLGH